jgi:hypothetical protein
MIRSFSRDSRSFVFSGAIFIAPPRLAGGMAFCRAYQDAAGGDDREGDDDEILGRDEGDVK